MTQGSNLSGSLGNPPFVVGGASPHLSSPNIHPSCPSRPVRPGMGLRPPPPQTAHLRVDYLRKCMPVELHTVFSDLKDPDQKSSQKSTQKFELY